MPGYDKAGPGFFRVYRYLCPRCGALSGASTFLSVGGGVYANGIKAPGRPIWPQLLLFLGRTKKKKKEKRPKRGCRETLPWQIG